METWRKKESPSILVEAVRLNEANAEAVASWCGGFLVDEIDPEHPEEKRPGINVETPQGTKRASLNSYVVKYGKNFFVENIRPFEMLYEPANRPSPPPESNGEARHQRGFSDPFGGVLGGRST